MKKPHQTYRLIHPDVKAIILDWDDNLVDTITNKWEQHRQIAKQHYDKDLSDEELHEHWGKPLDTLLTLLYETDDADEAMKHIVAGHAKFPKTLFPESRKVLQELHKAGYLLGVVTGTSLPNLTFDIENLGVTEKFDYIQTYEDTKFHKPDPRVFIPAKAWLSDQGIGPHQVLYLGDGLVDMHAAIGAGFHFIGTGRGLYKPADFKQHGAEGIDHIGLLLEK